MTGWTYDPDAQAIRTPTGYTITLAEIAQRIQDDAACRYDFGGPWAGWKMRGDRLIPPYSGRNGPVLKPDTAPALAQWIADATRQVVTPSAGRPKLHVVR